MKGRLSFISLWWSTISTREQRLLVSAIVFVVAAVMYWGVAQPLVTRAENAQTKLASEQQLLQWVTNRADTIVELRQRSGAPSSSKAINQVVSESVKRYNIELIRMQPRDEMLQIWIKPVPFNQFITWIQYLKEQQGIAVEFMDISASDKQGMIDVKRLQLKRGG